MEEKFQELMEDESFAAELAKAENVAEIQALLAGKGIQLTEDELHSILANAPVAEELDENALEDVSGGVRAIFIGGRFFKSLAEYLRWLRTRRRW